MDSDFQFIMRNNSPQNVIFSLLKGSRIVWHFSKAGRRTRPPISYSYWELCTSSFDRYEKGLSVMALYFLCLLYECIPLAIDLSKEKISIKTESYTFSLFTLVLVLRLLDISVTCQLNSLHYTPYDTNYYFLKEGQIFLCVIIYNTQ